MRRVVFVIFGFSFLLVWIFPKETIVRSDKLVPSPLSVERDYKNSENAANRRINRASTDSPLIDAAPVNGSLSAVEMFELASLLRRCKNIPSSDSALSIWLENANAAGEPSEYIADVVSKFELCQKHIAKEQNYISLLEKEPELGSDDAVYTLWAIGDEEYLQSLDENSASQDELAKKRIAFTQKKYDLAHKVALQGGERSLELLVKGYQHFDPATQGQSFFKSVAYANVAMEMTRNNELYRKLEWIKQRLINRMSTDELEESQILTEKLLAESTFAQN